jgi:AraC family transcriptional regulator of adaptative response / DNA-3-methyladenine glycosylase II
VPGAADGAEIAVRAVLGQQVSVASARGTAARIVVSLGEPLAQPLGSLTHLFPSPAALAAADPALLPVPAARAATIQALAQQLADGRVTLDPGADRGETRSHLLEIPGIGPWTAEYIAMRALADTDAFPATDLGVLRSLAALGGDHAAPPRSKAASALSERWRPWRAYAVMHLWSAE